MSHVLRILSSGEPGTAPTDNISDGIPTRTKLYWSLRMKIFRSGSGSGCSFTPLPAVMRLSRSPRSDSASPYAISTFNGTIGRNSSVFRSATIDFTGTVGCAAKYLEPSRPFSSAVTHTNRIDRFSGCGCFAIERASSSSSALPEALSIAPLLIRSPLIGSPTPMWSMCADRTTYSSRSAGSRPLIVATTLVESTSFTVRRVLSRTESGSTNRGSARRSLPSAAISANVCVVPLNSCSAWAGLNIAASMAPCVSSNSLAARYMLGRERLRAMRGHGISIDAGFGNTIVPIAPAALRARQRTADD